MGEVEWRRQLERCSLLSHPKATEDEDDDDEEDWEVTLNGYGSLNRDCGDPDIKETIHPVGVFTLQNLMGDAQSSRLVTRRRSSW